jgi:hypothetical protein
MKLRFPRIILVIACVFMSIECFAQDLSKPSKKWKSLGEQSGIKAFYLIHKDKRVSWCFLNTTADNLKFDYTIELVGAGGATKLQKGSAFVKARTLKGGQWEGCVTYIYNAQKKTVMPTGAKLLFVVVPKWLNAGSKDGVVIQYAIAGYSREKAKYIFVNTNAFKISIRVTLEFITQGGKQIRQLTRTLKPLSTPNKRYAQSYVAAKKSIIEGVRIGKFEVLKQWPISSHTKGVLNIAKKVAKEKYKGWTYGGKASKKQVDCVQFVLSVVKERLGTKSSTKRMKKIEKDILIANLPLFNSADLNRFVEKGDKRVSGVQHGLVSAGLGSPVTIDNVTTGDMIQYWKKDKNGNWSGHAGVIEKIKVAPQMKNGKKNSEAMIKQVKLFGAHQSLGRVGTSKYWVDLVGSKETKIYIVRMK